MSRNLVQQNCKAFSFHVSIYFIMSPKSVKNHFLSITFIVSLVICAWGYLTAGLLSRYTSWRAHWCTDLLWSTTSKGGGVVFQNCSLSTLFDRIKWFGYTKIPKVGSSIVNIRNNRVNRTNIVFCYLFVQQKCTLSVRLLSANKMVLQ